MLLCLVGNSTVELGILKAKVRDQIKKKETRESTDVYICGRRSACSVFITFNAN